MGESKRKRESLSPVDRAALQLSHDLANKGMLVEGGFAAYAMHAKLSLDHPLLSAFRDAYMSGAEHLWSSFMATLEGSEETPADMRRMALIQAEIDKWREKKMAELATSYPTKGSA